MALAHNVTTQPAVQPVKESPRRHLRAVTSPATSTANGTLGLAVLAIVALLGIFATQLWLSVATSQGAYTANDLILEERELARIERVMQQEVFVASSPQNLSEKASQQGMVQNARPAFLTLDGSTIQGELSQQSSATRTNIVPNAALSEYNTPVAEKLQQERAASLEKQREAAQTAAAEKAEAEKTATTDAPTPVKPSGPVTWSDALPAPATH